MSKFPLLFVTSNQNKVREIREILQVPTESISLDLDELQTTDLDELITHKLMQAYQHVQQPVFVEDTALYFSAWKELPGPLIKWFLENMGTTGLYQALSSFADHSATAICSIGYYDGKQQHIFKGVIKGTIRSPQGENGFGWDTIFCPQGHQQTFAEMEIEEKKNNSMRRLALEKLWEFLVQPVDQK